MGKKLREPIEVDEEYLKEMMTGEIPRLKRESKLKAAAKDEQQGEPSETPSLEEKTTGGIQRKKKQPQSYDKLFLKRNPINFRRQTYISAEVYDKISEFLPMIAKRLGIAAYIDNILQNHMDQFQDEINELYKKNTKTPFED